MKYKEKRKSRRNDFSYPADLKIFTPNSDRMWISGFLKDISIEGLCIHFRDKYGKIALEQIKNARVKVKIVEPDGENMFLLGEICWVKSKKIKDEQTVTMGIECQELPNWQAERLEKFILLQGKEHKMLWHLWDTYIRTHTEPSTSLQSR